MRKPGWKTTQFWLAAVAMANFTFLTVWGAVHRDIGMITAGSTGVSSTAGAYLVARHVANHPDVEQKAP